MSIQYALFENHLTPDPTDYTAIVQPRASMGFDDIADEIVGQGTTVTRPDILASLEGAVVACEKFLLQGNRIVLGNLVQLFPRIKGIFDDPTDGFDSSRHQLDVGANPGQRVRETVRNNGTVEKITAVVPSPVPTRFLDVASAEVNGVITINSMAHINGDRLKFDPLQPDEGIYFVPTAGGVGTKVLTTGQNLPTFLSFMTPALTPGEYNVEVRSRMKNSGDLRIGRLNKTLTV